LTRIHEVLGIAVLASNAVAAAWGGAAWYRGDPSKLFWYLLRVAQATVVAEAVVGVVLALRGHHASAIHYVYGISPLVVSLVTEGARLTVASAEVARVDDVETLDRRERILMARRIVIREIGVMTIGAILIVTLCLRAVATGS
jgi:Ca2+/Na+ antiporter